MAQVHAGINVTVEHQARPGTATTKNSHGIGSVGFDFLADADQPILLEPLAKLQSPVALMSVLLAARL
jgi:hypothetical protein